MEQKGFRRKLTAILSADVAGYSRLMQDDEAATVKILEAYKQIISDLVKQHRGRVVDSPGDNLLAEFASVVDAVQCAVATQKELQARNTELPENRKMQFRIGVNLGDVIEEESRIYGDGVNIAARLESLADPGGICISKTAFDQIETKLPFGYAYLGEQTVKNIAKPVGAYKVLMEPRVTKERGAGTKGQGAKRRMAIIGLIAALVLVAGAAMWQFFLRSAAPPVEKADPKHMALPLPEMPSIAVLPFVNLSEDPKQELLCDGITENIINAFSKVPRLFVIARNSTFTYKGKAVKVKQVSEELGVRYVLEGSVQRSGDRVRISVQLVDAITASQLLSERFDGETTDLFALQDDITLKVLNAVRVKLEGEGATGSLKYFKGKQGLDCMLKGLEAAIYIQRQTIPDTTLARQTAEDGLVVCPENPYFYRYLAMAHQNDYWLGSAKSPRESIEKATELLEKALAIDDGYVDAHAQLSHVYTLRKEYDKSVAEGELAVSLAPGSAWALFWYASALSSAGRPEEALPLFEKAIRLNPLGPMMFYHNFANALRQAGRLEEAVASYKKAIERSPNYFWSHAMLAVVYSQMDKDKEARAAAAEVMRINPRFSLEWVARVSIIRDPSRLNELINAMRKAGLPDKPPLPFPDKPSIAVLPFVNMSKDPEQDYFGDGLAEEIINALAKLPQVFVIARNSSFSYKGKPMDVRQMGRELGVKYVLEGSIRQEGKRVRITAQFVDTGTGHHVFSEKYDRHLQEIFATQDDITMRVVKSLQLNLTEGEQALVYAKGTNNLEAYLKLLQATEYGRRQNPNDNEKAKRIIGEAIELDRNYPMAYRLLGALYMMEVWLGSSSSPQNSLQKAAELSQKAIDLDPSLGMAYAVLGHIHILSRDFQRGIELGEKAVELEPNGADSHAYLGMGLVFSDRAEEAVMSFKKAIRLNPDAPAWYLLNLATAYRVMGSYEEAIEWAKKAVERQPTNHFAHLVLTGSYSLAGREGESKTEADQVLRTNPKFSLERFAKVNPYKNQEAHKQYIDSLSKAGLK